MTHFSQETAGFAALTIVEFLIQECVRKGYLSEKDVTRLLSSAACRHEGLAEGDLEKVEMNMDAARLIRTLMVGLKPLYAASETSKNDDARSSSAPGP
ncbi:hypothetical protein [Sneathiella sp.]|jgi:hypothetical protein|uniref:hypothetical protein n=1 Tax=Sneathiella sp. TaxID=1964365 RepID=UPI0039E4A72D